jgi:hypothetical protein
MMVKQLIVSTALSVGVYRPVGVDKAIAMSAWGRMLSFGLSFEERSGEKGIEALKRGHSSMARERALRRRGRKVSRVKCVEGSHLTGTRDSGKIASGEMAGGRGGVEFGDGGA